MQFRFRSPTHTPAATIRLTMEHQGVNAGLALAVLLMLTVAEASAGERADCPSHLDLEKAYLASDETVRLCDAFRGKVVLVVNTASRCAYTPQYDGLEALYRRYRDRGLIVAGFPSNDFGAQEPGTEKTIQKFCRLTYSVDFPMFEKTAVRRDVAGPLFRRLGELAGDWPRWNFHKYLLDRDGNVVKSFPSHLKPADPEINEAIVELL